MTVLRKEDKVYFKYQMLLYICIKEQYHLFFQNLHKFEIVAKASINPFNRLKIKEYFHCFLS